MTGSTSSRRLGRSLLVLLTLLGTAVVAEGGTRLVAALAGRPWDSAAARASLVERRERAVRAVAAAPIADAGPDTPVLHPYVAWKRRGAIEEEADVRRDADRPFHLAVLGGTAAVDFVAHGGERLAELVARAPALAGRPVRVLPYCERGHHAPQSATALEWAIVNGVPLDAAVFVDGFETIPIGITNAHIGAWPLYPSSERHAPMLAGRARSDESDGFTAAWWTACRNGERRASRVLRARLLHSAIVGPAAMRWVHRAWDEADAAAVALEAALEDVRSVDVSVFGPTPPTRADRVLDVITFGWVESSVSLAASCRRRGIAYVHAIDGIAAEDAAHPPAAARPEPAETVDFVRDRLGAARRELVARGVPVLESAPRVNRGGQQAHALAETIAAALIEALP